MSRLTLTPGMESRLDGAPGVDLDEEELDARAKFFISQGMSPREALARAEAEIDARKDAAAAREAGLADASRQRQEAWDMAGTDQRPTDVQGAEADYDRELATDIAGSYRQDGPVLRPGTPGFAARDRRMAMEGAPFTRGRSEDPIDDDVALRQEYERRFGRPPRTPEEVDFARKLMVDDFQRKWSQAPGRWGSQQPFESQRQMDDYEASSPGQPSQLQADMYGSQGGPMVLRQYEDGRRGPAIAAPMPGIGEQYQVYDPETGGYEVRIRDANTDLSGGTSNTAFQDSLEAPLRRPDLERPKELGGGDNLPTLVEGPAGPEWVYRMSPEAQAEATRKRDAFLYEQRMDRLARRSGRSYQDVDEKLPLPEELRGGDDMAMRQLKRDARRKYEDRKAEQVANARRIQTENARMNSGQLGLQMQQMDPGFEQVMLLDRMTGGRRGGATPLDVQAAGAEAMRQQMLNRAFQSPEERLRNLLAERQMANELRQTNPDLAGQQDIASGNYTTREAQTHFSNLAADHDTTSGGFSVEDEANLRDTLMGPPYNMDRRTAERKAFELAESRRWLGGEQPAGEPTEPPEAPPAPAAEEPRRKTAGRRKRTEPVTPPRFPPAAGRGGGRNSSQPAEIPAWLRGLMNSRGATGRQGRGR